MQHLQLQRTLKFTTDDLRANREGRLSDAQHDKHKPPEVSRLALYVVIGHAVVIVSILGAIALLTGSTAMWIVVGAMLVLGLLPFIIMNNEGNINPTLRGDVKQGAVKQVCGMAIVKKETNRHHISRYELYIDGMSFKLSATQAGGFISEQDYCVYYLPLSKTLLSAEPYRADTH
ncbi:MAG: hypothetical protein ACFE0Q_20235 [Anaerolineae bacterium]